MEVVVDPVVEVEGETPAGKAPLRSQFQTAGSVGVRPARRCRVAGVSARSADHCDWSTRSLLLQVCLVDPIDVSLGVGATTRR